MIINLKDITYPIGKLKIFDEMDFNVKKGDLIFITGGNGSGKSTLLNIIAGEINNFKGTKFINSNRITKISQFSRNDYIKEISALLNLLILSNLITEKEKVNSINNNTHNAKEYLKALNQKFFNINFSKPISELTSYEVSFLNLYRIFLTKPEIILLDEPTALLFGEEIEEFNLQLRLFIEENQSTMLYVTHNIEDIKSFNATIYELDDKKLKLIRNTAHNSTYPKGGLSSSYES